MKRKLGQCVTSVIRILVNVVILRIIAIYVIVFVVLLKPVDTCENIFHDAQIFSYLYLSL